MQNALLVISNLTWLDLTCGWGQYRSKEPINVSNVPFHIFFARRFPVWKRRTLFFTCFDYLVLL
jgi:hypothetical protein